jgi:hypothetical protein
MANPINKPVIQDSHTIWQHNSRNLERLSEKTSLPQENTQKRNDSVTINYHQEVSMTYQSSLTIQTGDPQDQYNLLRELVTNMFKEQGIDFKIANGDQSIDISEISQEDASALVADDGYFGIEQTSDRIVDFAIAMAGGDTSRLAAIKEGVENGFNEALEAFGGTLPEISHDTYDAIMDKLDAWAERDSTEEAS